MQSHTTIVNTIFFVCLVTFEAPTLPSMIVQQFILNVFYIFSFSITPKVKKSLSYLLDHKK